MNKQFITLMLITLVLFGTSRSLASDEQEPQADESSQQTSDTELQITIPEIETPPSFEIKKSHDEYYPPVSQDQVNDE